MTPAPDEVIISWREKQERRKKEDERVAVPKRLERGSIRDGEWLVVGDKLARNIEVRRYPEYSFL